MYRKIISSLLFFFDKISAVYLKNKKGKNKYKKEHLVTWCTYSIGYKFESLDTVYANYLFFYWRYHGVWLMTRCGSLMKSGYNLHNWSLCISILILMGVIARALAFFCMLTFQKKWRPIIRQAATITNLGAFKL